MDHSKKKKKKKKEISSLKLAFDLVLNNQLILDIALSRELAMLCTLIAFLRVYSEREKRR